RESARRANTSKRLAADSPMPVTPPSTLQASEIVCCSLNHEGLQ
nr:hypothetical protein [Tanacetum cinerariifolium]